jgi:hypothetical protein
MNSLILLFGLLLCTIFCAPWQIGAEKNVEKNGIAFETFREQEDGTKLGILAGDTVIDGWPCAAGFVVLYPDWRPDELKLSRDFERNGIPFPSGTWVFPDEQGNPAACMMPRDVEIQGHLCRGGWGGKEGVMVSFYPGGQLKQYFCREDPVIDGVPCNGSVFACGITLHENGRLQQCKLAKDTTIGGVEYPRGAVLRFDRAGHVVDDQ